MAKITRQAKASALKASTTIPEASQVDESHAAASDASAAHGTIGTGLSPEATASASGTLSEDTPREPAQGGSSDPAAPAGEDIGDQYPLAAAAFDAWRGENLPAGVRITSLRDGFRRAGIAHTKLPVDHTFDSLGPWEVAMAKLEQLLGESNLKVELI